MKTAMEIKMEAKKVIEGLIAARANFKTNESSRAVYGWTDSYRESEDNPAKLITLDMTEEDAFEVLKCHYTAESASKLRAIISIRVLAGRKPIEIVETLLKEILGEMK